MQHEPAHAALGIALERDLRIHHRIEELVLGRGVDRDAGLAGHLHRQTAVLDRDVQPNRRCQRVIADVLRQLPGRQRDLDGQLDLTARRALIHAVLAQNECDDLAGSVAFE